MPSLTYTLFIRTEKHLSVRKWQAAFTPEGQLDIGRALGRIHREVSFHLHGFKTAINVSRYNTQACEKKFASRLACFLELVDLYYFSFYLISGVSSLFFVRWSQNLLMWA